MFGPAAVTTLALGAAVMAPALQPRTDWVGSTLLNEAATRVPPDMLDELAAGWPENEKGWDRWKRTVDDFLSTVQFRRDMLEEIRR